MSKVTETAQSYWDSRSELFANYYQKPSLFDRIFRKGVYGRVAVAIKACRDIPNAKVLDIGSGPGINSISLIKNSNASYVIGIDFSDQMISFASNLVKAEGVSDKINFILGDAMTYDFGKEKFDFSIALGVFDYTQDAEKLIKRMSELTTNSFVISWPENGLRMQMRRYRYTCPVYHYSLEQIKKLHLSAGINEENLELVRLAGGWATIAKK